MLITSLEVRGLRREVRVKTFYPRRRSPGAPSRSSPRPPSAHRKYGVGIRGAEISNHKVALGI